MSDTSLVLNMSIISLEGLLAALNNLLAELEEKSKNKWDHIVFQCRNKLEMKNTPFSEKVDFICRELQSHLDNTDKELFGAQIDEIAKSGIMLKQGLDEVKSLKQIGSG